MPETCSQAEMFRGSTTLFDSTLSIEWDIENTEHFATQVVGTTIESPIFCPKRSDLKWQLLLSIRDVCSSSLSLRVDSSCEVRQLYVRYHFGIVNVAGTLERDFKGEAHISSKQESNQELPTMLFNWTQIIESKTKFFSDGRLRIRCDLCVLDYVNHSQSTGQMYPRLA